jgi:hypothetical protein
MSEKEEKKPGLGAKIAGGIIILAMVGGVWQCATGGGSSSSSTSNTAEAQQAVKDFENSPAARVSSYAEACNFVVGLRAKGVGMEGIYPMVKLLRQAGKNAAADYIERANRDIGE